MAAIGVVATLTVAEGKNADFEAAFSELMAAVSANEPGNEFYSVFRSKDNPQHGSRPRDRISGRILVQPIAGQYPAKFKLEGVGAVFCE